MILHSFRFVGLSFLIPGVVSPDLPVAFAAPAAYGDLNCVACPIVNRIVRCHHAQRVPILARRGMANEFERFLHYNSASRFPRTDHAHAQPHSMGWMSEGSRRSAKPTAITSRSIRAGSTASTSASSPMAHRFKKGNRVRLEIVYRQIKSLGHECIVVGRTIIYQARSAQIRSSIRASIPPR